MKKLLILSLLMLFAVSAGAQSYNLKYNFKKGETYIYRDVTNNDMTQQMMGQEMKVNTSAVNVVRMVTDYNSPDSISLIISFDSITAKTKTPQIDTTITMDQIIGKRTRITLNNKGKVLSKMMLDSVDMENEMMQMGENTALQFSDLPENPVKTGEKWTINRVDTLHMMGGNMVMTHEIEYTLEGKVEKLGMTVLKLPFTAKTKIEGKGKMMGFEFYLDGSGTSSGDFYFSNEKGIPVSTEAVQNLDVTMAATGDQNMIIPINQSVKVTRTLVK